MQWLDNLGESISRRLALHASRRSVLSTLGKAMVASASVIPVLPVARAESSSSSEKPVLDPTDVTEEELLSCEYWRHCAVDGFLCGCCGGTATSCPPGTDPSPISWVGTCHNPNDGKDYLVSYHDCCGKTACNRCGCDTHVRERPGYEFFLHNDVNWCIANESSIYHCTVSVVVGLAKN